MSEKLTSAEAYEYIKTKEFLSYPEGVFNRTQIDRLLDEAGVLHDFTPPSAKSFLDWARRTNLVEPVEGERGHYRWAPDMETEAQEIGRQIVQEHAETIATDLDPEYPMLLSEDPEVHEVPLRRAEGIVDGGHLHLSVTGHKRFPRKVKAALKRTLIETTAARKVILTFPDKVTL